MIVACIKGKEGVCYKLESSKQLCVSRMTGSLQRGESVCDRSSLLLQWDTIEKSLDPWGKSLHSSGYIIVVTGTYNCSTGICVTYL